MAQRSNFGHDWYYLIEQMKDKESHLEYIGKLIWDMRIYKEPWNARVRPITEQLLYHNAAIFALLQLNETFFPDSVKFSITFVNQ